MGFEDQIIVLLVSALVGERAFKYARPKNGSANLCNDKMRSVFEIVSGLRDRAVSRDAVSADRSERLTKVLDKLADTMDVLRDEIKDMKREVATCSVRNASARS